MPPDNAFDWAGSTRTTHRRRSLRLHEQFCGSDLVLQTQYVPRSTDRSLSEPTAKYPLRKDADRRFRNQPEWLPLGLEDPDTPGQLYQDPLAQPVHETFASSYYFR